VNGFHPLAVVAVLNFAAAVSPGPAFLLVTRTAAVSKRPVALATVAGTVTASIIWAAAALLGWELFLARMATVYRFLEIGGGLYLCSIGWSTWQNAPQPLPESERHASGSVNAKFRKGLLLGLSNPEVVVFFGTIFTSVFTPCTPSSVRWAALVVIFVNESFWYASVALAFGTPTIRKMYGRWKILTERFFGSVLVFFGLRLVCSGGRHR
jgi:threonine efflux protein